ncbi:MAG: hypothetical protein Q8N26_17265 [Myxococcales bacterium]|nr:hypothetical protein [Myxococcales bacterium]
MTATQLVLASPATWSELVSRLPAEARAQVAWTPKRIADMAAALLEVPLLTDGAIEAAGDAYLEAARALSPALLKLAPVAKDLSALVQTGLENDLRLLTALAPANAKAAVRATATILVLAHLGLQALGRIEIAELEKALAELDASPQDQHLSLLQAAALVTAVFEGLRRGSPVPGRVEALARRADAAAAEFAARLARDDDALRLPWYVESAPGAASVESFAAWNPANRASLRQVSQPTREELEAWERVKADIDSARPHRKLFT